MCKARHLQGGGGIWNDGTNLPEGGWSSPLNAWTQVTGCTFSCNNATIWFYNSRCGLVLMSALSYKNRLQQNAGGGILHSVGHLMVSSSYFQHNIAATLGGGGLYSGEYETYKLCKHGETLVMNSTFISNRAMYGGGALVHGEACMYTATAIFLKCNFTSNSAISGGAVYATCNSGLCASFLESSFSSNRAQQGGGGAIFSSLPPNITCAASGLLSNSSSGCVSWAGNVAEGGYGDCVATPPVVLRTPVELYSAQASQQPLLNFTASLFDGLDQLVRGLQYDGKVVSLAIVHGTGQLHGAVTAAFKNGVASFSGVNIIDTPGLNVLHLAVSSFTISSSASALPPVVVRSEASVDVRIRPCVAGEVRSKDNRTCSVCAFPRFSWDPNNITCDNCPEHAICESGALVAPEDGCWHSSQQSFVFHKCPNPVACTYHDRTGAIVNAIVNNSYTIDLQCSMGYFGNLCGVCAEGYGVSGFPGNFVCRRCPAKGWMALYFILWILLQVSLVVGLIHLHLAANAPSRLSQDRTRLNGAARLKIVIHFFQAVSLAFYLQNRWPKFVDYLFATTGTLSLSQSLLIPLECFVPRELGATLSPAYSVNIFYAILPVIALAPSLVFWPLRYHAYVASRSALASLDGSVMPHVEVDIIDLAASNPDEHGNNSGIAAAACEAREPQGDAATARRGEGESPGGGHLVASRPTDAVERYPLEALVALHIPALMHESNMIPAKASSNSLRVHLLHAEAGANDAGIGTPAGTHLRGDTSRPQTPSTGRSAAAATSPSTTTATVAEGPILELGEYLCQRYALSAVCTALLIWPSVVSNIVSLFACRRIDRVTDNDPYYQNAIAQGYFWQQDLNERCYEGSHLKHVLIIGLPGLLFYCLLIPSGVFFWLWHKKRSLDNARVFGTFGVLYQQYRPNCFFWDGILLLQKYLLIINSILLEKFGAQLQVSIAFAIILCSVTIHWRVESFTTRCLNFIHAQLCYTATATVWFGMVYFLGLSAGAITVVSMLLGMLCLIPAVLMVLTIPIGRLQDYRKLSSHKAHIEDGNNLLARFCRV